MKIYKLFIVALFAFVATSCFWSEENSNANNAVNSANNAPESVNSNTRAENKPVEPEIIYPKETYSQESPTEAFQTYIKATVNKDIEGLKKSLSKSSLEFIEKSAKEQGKTVDELLTGGAVENKSKKIPEIRGEQINGDTATVEYKDETMPEFIKMPLVKENGIWKVSLDQFMQDLLKKFQQMQNK